jgi:hypothetical protein
MHVLRVASLVSSAAMVFCAVALAQGAQVESTPVPMNAKPDFSKMSFLVGTWNCSVLSSRRPGPYRTTSVTTMSTDGYWLMTRTTVHKASWIPREFSGDVRTTYDPSTSKWIQLSYDDQGGYDLSTSPGWNGNSITWTDVFYPKTNATAVSNPTTMTKISDARTSSSSTFREPSGRLVSVKTTCSKNG